MNAIFHNIRRLTLIALCACSLHAVAQDGSKPKRSQVVDDSTKNVYGPKTTLWTTESTLFFKRKPLYQPLDTSLSNYHRWTHVQRYNNFYKDLGVMGTALHPIFPTLSKTIGATSGFTGYEPYFRTEEPKLYDSKSPYTRLFIVWGGNGRAMTRIEFTRNINPRWNFGFDYRPILIDKQIQYRKADRLVVSHYYDFFTTYKTKDEKYRALFTYRRIRHRVFENGGILIKTTDPYTKYFDKQAMINMSNTGGSAFTITEEKRSVLHLYQQYQLAGPFQVYLSNDFSLQMNRFSKNGTENYLATSAAPAYFAFSRGDSISVSDISQFKSFQHEAGIKGNAGPLFYNFYYKIRSFNYLGSYYTRHQHDLTAYSKSATEHYVGGQVALKFDSLTELTGAADILKDGNYRLEANWRSPWIDASAISSLSKPGFMQQVYYGSHNLWDNAFANTAALQVNGYLKGHFGPLTLSPGATFTNLNNYVYFKEKSDVLEDTYVKPHNVASFQSHGTQTVFSPEVRMTLRMIRHIYFRPQAIYTVFLKNDNDALHIPAFFLNGQLAYENHIFKGKMEVQIGIDAHWKSSYKALGYDLAIQQFYIQNQYVSPSFLLADFFFNAKLKRGKFFLKYSNLKQAFTGGGYVPTPAYPGQRSALDFGFELILFD